MAKEYTFGVRSVSRFGRQDASAGLFNKADIEKYCAEMVKDGWRLMGQPQFTGMEDYRDFQQEAVRLMYWWERGT
jgi:hypothetical protein